MANGVGRPPFNPDLERLIDMMQEGVPKKEIADSLGCSVTTLNKNIAEIREKEGILLQWRAIRSLRLTEIQAAILNNISPEKIADASLKDLVLAYKILAEKENEIEHPEKGKITGLVAYLLELERREFALRSGNTALGETIDVTPEDELPDDTSDVPQF